MPDDSRPSKRSRVDEAATSGDSSVTPLDDLKRDPDIWLEDGNIVIVARDVAFRTYRGLLTKQSTVFADMFGAGDLAADESLDGCPVVRLPDAPSDLKHLLHSLVPSTGRTLLQCKRPIAFPELFAIIRLSHKYNIEDLLGQGLHILKTLYTTSFRQFEGDAYRHANLQYPHPEYHIGAVNLARLTNNLSILPVALYHCCGLSGKVMDGWTRDTGETEFLSAQDIRAVITGRDQLARKGFRTLLNIFDEDTSSGCTQPGVCMIGLAGLIRSVRWDGAGEYDILDSWKPVIKRFTKELGLCKPCRDRLVKRDLKERREVWEKLPSLFGLSKDDCQWNKPVGGDDSESNSGESDSD
uniref:Two-component-like hybrid sensor histidine kinase 1 n=1 Tax=Ganoderma boninense TaxID=34458 RepID=A0A5K1K623_9APHY|nr:Two-component-like hybrid sensor histidine kinase 1 [Ganoderma boninense]